MSKVLVIGPDYYNFLLAVEDAFRKCGCECISLGYDNPVNPYTPFKKAVYKCSPAPCRRKMIRRSRADFNARAAELFNSEKPDLVFLMNGDIMEPATLDLFRSRARVSLWLFDNISKMPSSIETAAHCDHLYSFDKGDVASLVEAGLKAEFLPQACDTELYYITGTLKDIDILFVGDLYYYPNRQMLLKKVVRAFRGSRILVIGKYKPWYKNPFKWLFRERRDIYTNDGILPEMVNFYCNRAKVVLNIHREDQKNGANPRVFEICGSGAYQVCDRNPYLSSIFTDGEVGLYDDAEEMISLIEDALSHDMSDRAKAAHDLTMADHTYECRMRKVLADAGL